MDVEDRYIPGDLKIWAQIFKPEWTRLIQFSALGSPAPRSTQRPSRDHQGRGDDVSNAITSTNTRVLRGGPVLVGNALSLIESTAGSGSRHLVMTCGYASDTPGTIAYERFSFLLQHHTYQYPYLTFPEHDLIVNVSPLVTPTSPCEVGVIELEKLLFESGQNYVYWSWDRYLSWSQAHRPADFDPRVGSTIRRVGQSVLSFHQDECIYGPITLALRATGQQADKRFASVAFAGDEDSVACTASRGTSRPIATRTTKRMCSASRIASGMSKP